jgi:SAM-dependent methyltransferase
MAQMATFRRLTTDYPLSGRCLNAGCGEGLYCPFIDSFPAVSHVVNVDLARTPERLRKYPAPRYTALDASLTDLPFESAYFDSAICTEVLEHIPDDSAAVSELARCLKPGAVLLVSVPSPPAPFDPAHVREGYSVADLTSLLAAHGLQVKNSAKCMSWWMATLLAVWRWQYTLLGRGKRNLMPRFVVRAVGRLDSIFPVGRTWDLVVVAVRQ